MRLLDLLPSNSPSLSDQLRRRTEELRSKIVKANYNTQFAQTAPELADFRHATTGLVDGMDGDSLSETFRKTVYFTTSDSYRPLLAKILRGPCKASDIVDLFASGLPNCLSVSSSTSGGRRKSFAKYNAWSKIGSSDTEWCVISDPPRRRTRAHICYLGFIRIDVLDEHDRPVITIHLTSASTTKERMRLSLNPEEDGERMGTFILDHAAPYAAAFIKKWRSFLLIHALFAVGSRALETMSMVFINTFVDMIRHLDMEFDMVVDCIASGTIPALDGIADVRQYLEINILPDPERAAELRRLGRPSSRPGWCAHVWPNLRSVTATASGSFASSVPLAQRLLGPNIGIHARGYGSAEAWIASPYNPLESNQFKLSDKSIIIEFLDVCKSDSIGDLAQIWEVELGRRYEIVLTTSDGLWRYRLGDVVEISGFDPTDGVPVIQFVERRNVAIRFPDMMITEKDLRAAMSSVASDMVVNWTAAIDDRLAPSTIGFFVEFAGDQVSDLALAPDRMLDELLRSNGNIAWNLKSEKFRKPTIRLVRPGTFSEFLQLKLDEGSNNVGQIKVPVALPKDEYVAWFSERVLQEL